MTGRAFDYTLWQSRRGDERVRAYRKEDETVVFKVGGSSVLSRLREGEFHRKYKRVRLPR